MIIRLADVGLPAIAAARAACPDAFAARGRWRAWGAWTTVGAFTAYCLWLFDVSPRRLAEGVAKLTAVIVHMFPPTANEALQDYLYAMGQTVAMAFLGTFLAAVLAVPLGLACARNVATARVVQFCARRASDVLRGVDQLVWALIFVRAVGLGPLAGILAIVISDIGTLAKLYSEAIENVERKQLDGVRACGGNSLQTIRFGILPQVLPVLLSNALYIFESNTRSATILGIVGAGGIGFYLADRIRTLLWEEACFIMILILIAVYLIDWLSKLIRARLIHGKDASAPAGAL